MTNIDKQIEEFNKKFFISGKNAYGEEKALLFPAKIEVSDFLKQSLITIQKDTVKRAITLFQLALRDAELPEDVWKRIADTNGVLLEINI